MYPFESCLPPNMCPEVELLDHMVTLFLDFLGNLHAVFLSGYYKVFNLGTIDKPLLWLENFECGVLNFECKRYSNISGLYKVMLSSLTTLSQLQ